MAKTKKKKTRLDILQERLKKISDPEDMMMEIISIFDEKDWVPQVGKYYTFIYNAKTVGLLYDQHPLVACTEIYNWGFRGINFHFGDVRSYTWEEVAGQLHIVKKDEISYMRSLKYAKYISK